MDAVVSFDFAVEGVSRFLSFSGLTKLEATSRSSRSLLSSGKVWLDGASGELPGFDLLQQSDASMSVIDLKEMVATLKTVAVVGVPSVSLVSPSGVRDVVRAVGRADLRMSSHVAEGGSGKVALARFFFKPEAVRAMLVPRACAGGSECGVVGSTPCTFPACSHAGDVEINVKLMLRSNAVFLSATTDAHEASFVVDVQAVSPALLLQMRGARIQAGSHRSRGCGLMSIRGSVATAVDVLASGLLCVISIRSAPADVEDSRLSNAVHALHLDALRPTVAR